MSQKRTKAQKRVTNYTAETMRRAFESVRSGKLTGREAAVVFKVPYGTLNKKLSGRTSINAHGAGRPLEMGASNEQDLAEYLCISGNYGHGYNRGEILDFAAHFLKYRNIKTRWAQQVEGKPGTDWLRSFLKRHPELKVRKDEPPNIKKFFVPDPFEAYKFYDDLETLYMIEIIAREDSYRFYSVFEMSFPGSDFPNPDSKSTRNASSSSKNCKDLTSAAIFCIRADGGSLPLLLAFHGQCVSCEADGRSRTMFHPSEEANLFLHWFENLFVPHLPSLDDRCGKSIILFYGAFATNISAGVLYLAIQHNIILVKLPPNLKGYLQPIDSSRFSSLKSDWNELSFSGNFNNNFSNKNEAFGQMLATTWYSVCEKDDIIEGFERTGLFPVDRHKFDSNFIDANELKKYQEISNANNNEDMESLECNLNANLPGQSKRNNQSCIKRTKANSSKPFQTFSFKKFKSKSPRDNESRKKAIIKTREDEIFEIESEN